MREKVREIACPACLRKRLRVFRVEKAGLRTYFVTDPLQDQTREIEPWQFFVLEVLAECEGFSRLSLAVEERYGQPVDQEDVDRLLALVAEKKWFNASARTAPLVSDFNRRKPLRVGAPGGPGENGESGRTSLPASVLHVIDLGGRKSRKNWALFEPTWLLQVLHSLLVPLRRAIYLLPLLLVPAIVLTFRYRHQFSDDLSNWFGQISFLWHLLVGLLTVNLLATIATALVAYHYGVTVSAFCIVLYFVVWPRFMVRVGSVEKLPRRARAWYYAAPLLTRLAVLSVTMFLWFNSRQMEGALARFSLSVAIIAQISFLITAVPLGDSNGYRLLSTLLNAPKLREKAINALVNKLRRRTGESVDSSWMVVYALASSLFLLAIVAVFFLILGDFLESRLGRGAGVLALLAVAAVLWGRVATKVKTLKSASERAARFTNWRKREASETD